MTGDPGKRVLLIIGGGIAAYKALEVIRGLREREIAVTPVLTQAAERFVTPLSVTSLAGEALHQDLFDPLAEAKMGHIALSRAADLIVVAPATADFLGKMAGGLADDLASTLLLATDVPVLVAPAMNVRMWTHQAVRRNVVRLEEDGIGFIGPDSGPMACGETGPGRMAEPATIIDAIQRRLAGNRLAGRRLLVTSGATREPMDPVRFLSNRSSGRQGVEIARAALAMGAEVVLVSGHSEVDMPPGAQSIRVETARDMLKAVQSALPVDAAICVAAVADWRPRHVETGKKKKSELGTSPRIELVENPDILAHISNCEHHRPRLVVGFAAETGDLEQRALGKLHAKGCDWIIANDVAGEASVMGGPDNEIALITPNSIERWPKLPKRDVATRLVERIGDALAQ